jgi:hypothetical protein
MTGKHVLVSHLIGLLGIAGSKDAHLGLEACAVQPATASFLEEDAPTRPHGGPKELVAFLVDVGRGEIAL